MKNRIGVVVLCSFVAVAAEALPFKPSFSMTFGRETEKAPALTVRASEMKSFDVAESGGRHVCTWRGHDACGADFTVTGTFTARDGGWDYEFRYAGCASGMDVEEISFPEITVPRTDSTRLLFPRQTGALRLPKWKDQKPGAVLVQCGPMFLGFHFIAAVDEGAGGWYVDQRGDARLRSCRFAFVNGTDPGTLRLEAKYVPEATADLRASGALPFTGTVRPFRGGWYAAAALYRDWVSTQDWFRAAKARDFGKLRDIALWMWNRGRSGEVAPQAEKFMDDTGLPLGLDWYWWHEIPYDTAYPFFWPPREPVDDFRATIARLKARGAYVQTYTNGMLWDRTDPRWTEDGEREVLRLRDGRPRTEVFNVFTKADTAWMCGRAPVFQAKLREVERHLAASGLDGVYMDMIANCGCTFCWASNHGHPRGGGRAVADGYRRLFETVRAENPGLKLSSEEEGEAFVELVDSLIVLYGCYERLGCGVAPEIDYPPVFEAIYHGTVAMFGSYAVIDGVTPWDEKWGPRPAIDEAKWAGKFPDQFACEFARGVVQGLQPCVHKVLMEHMTDPKWAADWTFVKDTAKFYHANRAFLFDGEMRDPGRLACDTAPVDFFIRGCYTREEKFRTCRQKALPTVFHSVWKAPDGRIAAVVVNRTRQERAFSLDTPDIRATGTLPPLSWRLIPARTGNGANPETVELCPIPTPVAFTSDMDSPVPFDATAKVVVECPDAAAAGWLDAHFAAWFGANAPRAVAGETGLELRPGEEAYAAKADGAGVKIRARTLAGVRWAAYSIRQLALAKRGTFKVDGRILPSFEMSDSPLLAFRCVHLCWFPELREEQVERAIRLAALLKFNYAIIEPWGMYRSAKHPWWGWPDGKMTKEAIARLVALGRDLGITLIPQINAFGHASVARSCSLKNAILDLNPEYEPLFEPGGWNWCLSNPEAQRVLRELIAEMHGDFGNPPYFHLGCDEAQPPSCPACRKVPYGELVCRHITGLADFVAARGAKAMIWHDMLLERKDPRWKGFVACGTAATAKLADTLPKDVVICDWQYSYGNMKEVRKDWPTMEYFGSKGFPVAGCPWLNFNAMKPMADCLARIGGFGYIQTTWHHLRGNDWVKMYRMGSSAAWGTVPAPVAPQFDTAFGTALRLVGHDMKITDPRDTGHSNCQIPPSWWIDNN